MAFPPDVPVNPFADMGIADVHPAGASPGVMYGLDSKETLTRGEQYGVKVNPTLQHLLVRFVAAAHAADDFDVIFVEVCSANYDHKVRVEPDGLRIVATSRDLSVELREPLVVKTFDWVELRVFMKKDARVTLTAIGAEPPVEGVARDMVRYCKAAADNSEGHKLWLKRVLAMTAFEETYKSQRGIE